MNYRQMQTSLSEKESLMDMLTMEKELISMYTTSIMDMDSQNLRQTLSYNLHEAFLDQYGIYRNMNSRGYYPVQMAPISEVQQACQQYTQIGQQLK